MTLIATVLVAFVALEHFGFFVLESFLWTKPAGLKVFRNTPENAQIMKVLAANQGLYNGFLAAGLVWSLFAAPVLVVPLRLFFLGCVVIAGLFGGATVSPRIIVVQAAPAAVAFALVWLGS